MGRIRTAPDPRARPSPRGGKFAFGRPAEVLRRSSTVSGYPVVPSGILKAGSAGNTAILARTRPRSSTISRARPRSTGATSEAATAGRARLQDVEGQKGEFGPGRGVE